jgi:putative ABC transport system substrate-binding protein
MITRRVFVGSLTGGFLAAPLAAGAQPAKTIRIGWLSPGSTVTHGSFLDAFRQRLRELGYVEGRDLDIESRWAEGKFDRLPSLAVELVGLKVDVIVAAGPPAIQAVKQATTTIPIVMAIVVDAVATGLVTNLARPEGNITGLSIMPRELVGRQLGLLKEVVPEVSRVAFLGNPASPGNAPLLREAQDAAQALGVRLQPVEARDPNEIDSAFAEMTRERAGAVIVSTDTMLFIHRTRIADLAAKRRLPLVAPARQYVEAGGLMADGVIVPDLYRRAATYVDKILKGAKPGDLPVAQPTKFELVINLKTAKALGLNIPQSLLQRADQVVQ